MAVEYFLALATDLSPRAVVSAFSTVDVECEDTPRGPRCTATFEHLSIAVWMPSEAMRDSASREFSILATVWMSLRIDSEEPDEGHRSLLVAVRQILARVSCDVVLYRDEDMLLSRTNGDCSVSRKLVWDAADESALDLKDYRLVD